MTFINQYARALFNQLSGLNLFIYGVLWSADRTVHTQRPDFHFHQRKADKAVQKEQICGKGGKLVWLFWKLKSATKAFRRPEGHMKMWSFDVEAGTIVGVVGPNGGRKNHAVQLHQPYP